MNRRDRVSLGLMLLLLALMVLPAGAQMRGALGIAVGEAPAAVTIEDLEDAAVDLGQYIGQGRPTLIEFWATWCENCRALHPQMQEAHARYRDRVDFVAVAVGVAQTKRSITRHLKRMPVSYPTVWDTEGRAVRAFLAPATSYIVVLNEEGVVTYTGIGPEQDIFAAVETALETEGK